MVPDISLTRRQLLGGVGVTAGGITGTAIFAPAWLPDHLTDALLGMYPEPPAHVWRPPVSAEHADNAVARLSSTVDKAQELRAQVDRGSVSTKVAHRLYTDDPSGGWLDSAQSESNPHDRLFDATYGMQFAGEVLGYAKAARNDADIETLRTQGTQIRTAAQDIHDSISEYQVGDPATDLGYLYFLERALSFARLGAHDADDKPQEEEVKPHYIASTWAAHVQAKQRLANARYYRDLYESNITATARSFSAQLATALSSLMDSLNEFPTRTEMQTEIEAKIEDSNQTPYQVARRELLTLCYNTDHQAGYGEGGFKEGHTVQHIVDAAIELLSRQAHDYALSELAVSPDDTDYDSGHAFREKRQALRKFQSVRDQHPSPVAGILAQEPADRIRAGDVGITVFDGDDETPAWHDRVTAAVYYLVGNGMLRGLSDVLDTMIAEQQ